MTRRIPFTPLRRAATSLALLALFSLFSRAATRPQQDAIRSSVSGAAHGEPAALELSRPARPWEFLSAVGSRAALFGNEAGAMEAWVYPLKLLRNFHLLFHVDGRVLPAASLVRTLTVRPESATLLYAGDNFQVRETFFAPRQEPGVVIKLEVATTTPLQVEAVFQRDFQLEWPGALGGTYIAPAQGLDPSLRGAFYLGEEQKKFVALVGSPTGVIDRQEYATNSSASSENSLLLGATASGQDTKVIVMAGSVTGLPAAATAYHRLATDYDTLLAAAAAADRQYLANTVSLQLPDAQMQQAYDWARISVIQGLVTNPYLGTGLVAGYRTSGESQRPGFAWFFGRDALWTALALDAEGDFATTRTALDFLRTYQRADGKMAHEISQSASFVPWFKDYPYAYASADATPLYILVVNDYVMHSGDVAYARQHWDSIWKAYEFLRSTYDTQGLPQNQGVGTGWVEGGPLLPVKTELYQSGLGVAALQALANLARRVGKDDLGQDLDRQFAAHRALLNQLFWSRQQQLFSFGLDRDNRQVEVASVLSTVPMWFGVLDAAHSETMISRLADADQHTDWGMRILSANDPRYDPSGYHFGAVWPLFTGWAAVGEYRYHRALPAWANLRANALLALDGSLGHVTEVLSGDYYQSLSTSSPNQVWSAAMVVSPLLRGLLGLEVDAPARRLRFAPHLPADWDALRVGQVRVASAVVDLALHRTADGLVLEARRAAGTGPMEIEFSPAVSLRARLLGATLNGAPLPAHLVASAFDQHVSLTLPLDAGTATVRLRLRDDFGLVLPTALPKLGARSASLDVVSETWSPDRTQLTLVVAGRPGHSYDFGLRDAAALRTVVGASLLPAADGAACLRITFPSAATAAYTHRTVTLKFADAPRHSATGRG